MKKIILSVLAIGLSVGAFAQKQMVNVGSLEGKQQVQVADNNSKVQPIQKATMYLPPIFNDCADIEDPGYYVFTYQGYQLPITGSGFFGGAGQSYVFSSAKTVTGIAFMAMNDWDGDVVTPDIEMLNDGLSVLASTTYSTSDLVEGEWVMNSYNFAQPVNSQSFILGVYFPEYTATSTDVIISTTDAGCSEGFPIYLNYQGNWVDASTLFNGFDVHAFIFPIIEGSGLNDVEINNLTYVYPNPAKNEVMLASSYKMNKVEIFNMLGQKVYESDVNGISTTVNVVDFTAG
ncbi:MAG: T9SS type A sorting domain-containing protein, partial [Bacteroidales bacterium]|nr:T9SS type A sorting domain-containing protein [Bacteroidales bacterium]